MTAKMVVANRLHGMPFKFRDAVTEILLQATILKFRIVAQESAWRLKSLMAQRKAQAGSKNKKGAS